MLLWKKGNPFSACFFVHSCIILVFALVFSCLLLFLLISLPEWLCYNTR